MSESARNTRSPVVAAESPDLTTMGAASNGELPQRLRARLSVLAQLEPNWDGYGADRISSEILAAANAIALWMAETLPFVSDEPPDVTPMTGGRLQFEWHRGSRSLEIELESPTRIHYLRWDSEAGLDDENFVPTADREQVAELIRWFVEG